MINESDLLISEKYGVLYQKKKKKNAHTNKSAALGLLTFLCFLRESCFKRGRFVIRMGARFYVSSAAPKVLTAALFLTIFAV